MDSCLQVEDLTATEVFGVSGAKKCNVSSAAEPDQPRSNSFVEIPEKKEVDLQHEMLLTTLKVEFNVLIMARSSGKMTMFDPRSSFNSVPSTLVATNALTKSEQQSMGTLRPFSGMPSLNAFNKLNAKRSSEWFMSNENTIPMSKFASNRPFTSTNPGRRKPRLIQDFSKPSEQINIKNELMPSQLAMAVSPMTKVESFLTKQEATRKDATKKPQTVKDQKMTVPIIDVKTVGTEKPRADSIESKKSSSSSSSSRSKSSMSYNGVKVEDVDSTPDKKKEKKKHSKH